MDILINYWLLAYLALGLFTGILAGMFGVGGGAVMVPFLFMIFHAQNFPERHLMLISLATSMATIIFTAMSSSWAHHKRQAVNWSIVTKITPGILLGTVLGSSLASYINYRYLAFIFAGFITYVAMQLFQEKKPQPGRALPGTTGILAVGTGIGALSSLVAIGGGTLSVPFMVWCNIAMKNAIATSSAIGLPIAIGGTIGYVYHGLGVGQLPSFSFGYVYLPAVLVLAGASMLTAPLGAKIAHHLPVKILKRCFAVILLLVVAKMLNNIW